MGNIFSFIFLTVCWLCYGSIQGYDIFEGIAAGAPCFQPRSVNCCNKTLLQSYTPNARGRGTNSPDTKFFLFTLRNQRTPEFLHNCCGKLPINSYFNPKHKTEIFIHGWLDGTCRTAWMREMRDELFKKEKGEYNIILVDWTWGNTPDYALAASNNKVVGEQIAFVVNNIITQTKTGGDMFHLVGHSFGSHIAGFAGKRISGLRRITALDPAASPYQGQPPEFRLAKTDALIVDVIHTSDAECIVNGIGYTNPIGDVDFYPNSGKNQQKSLREIATKFLKLDFLYGAFILLPQFYDHLIAIQYYKASINPCGCEFVGVKCNNYRNYQHRACTSCNGNGTNCAVMGMNFELYYHKKNNRRHQKYYLHTISTCPYCNKNGMALDGFVVRNESNRCSNEDNLSGNFNLFGFKLF